jgi:ribosomal protein S18 acetylase RimI-like enzyme
MTKLTLRPMSDVEYEAGNWLEEESLELSKNALEQLLPQGRQTPRVLLLSADNSAGEYVGYLWIGLDRPNTSKLSAWIYDIEVAEEQRGRGYGRALLRAAEKETLKNGVPTLGLNVFGTNHVARKLYESSGYSITQIAMSKQLGVAEES